MKQWGSAPAGRTVTQAFPIAFPTSIYAIVCVSVSASAGEIYDTIIRTVSTTDATIYVGGSNYGHIPTKHYVVLGK